MNAGIASEPGVLPVNFRKTRTLTDGVTRLVAGRHNFLCCDVVVELPGSDGTVTAEQFADWARLSAALEHPNCARVEEYDLIDGLPYTIYRGTFVHPFEVSLPLSPDQLRTIAVGILRALEHAHERGVFHGWLGADSLLVPASDLGAVKVRNFAVDAHFGPEHQQVAQDLYCAGALLWKLATGLVDALPAEGNVRVPRATRNLVKRLCGIGAVARFATATEALAPLERASQGAGGILAEPTWVGGEDNPEPEPEPDVTIEHDTAYDLDLAEEVVDDDEWEAEQQRAAARRTTLLRRLSIGVMVASASVAALAVALRVGDREPRTDPAPAVSLDAGVAFARLDRINDTPTAATLPYDKRTALLRSLRADPRTADLIDDDLHAVLDLEQADSAADPCVAFRAALEAIARDPKPYFRAPLSRVPDDGLPEGCPGLDHQLALLQAAIGAR